MNTVDYFKYHPTLPAIAVAAFFSAVAWHSFQPRPPEYSVTERGAMNALFADLTHETVHRKVAEAIKKYTSSERRRLNHVIGEIAQRPDREGLTRLFARVAANR